MLSESEDGSSGHLHSDSLDQITRKMAQHSDILWPGLRSWYKPVTQYLSRQMAFDEDSLRAFVGVEEALSRSLGFQKPFLTLRYSGGLKLISQDGRTA